MTSPDCHNCACKLGDLHDPGCAVEQCPRCGGQAISCHCIYEINGMDATELDSEHPEIYTNGPTKEMQARWDAEWGKRRLSWTGVWPGVAECVEFGWYSRMTAAGWRSCDKAEPGATEDLNRLRTHAIWDADAGRFVRRQ